MLQWREEWREDEGGSAVVCWWRIRVELPIKDGGVRALMATGF